MILKIYIILFSLSLFIKDADKYCQVFWDQRCKLQFSDFIIVENEDSWIIEAKSAIGVSFNPRVVGDNKVELKVRTSFDKCESYMKGALDSVLLEHENIHFHIAEVYARKIRKCFQDIDCLTSNGAYEMYRLYLDSLDMVHDIYDDETVKGMNVEAQKKWGEKVQEQLFMLKDYAEPVFIVKECEK